MRKSAVLRIDKYLSTIRQKPSALPRSAVKNLLKIGDKGKNYGIFLFSAARDKLLRAHE